MMQTIEGAEQFQLCPEMNPPPPGYIESAQYLRQLLDVIERDIIMPIMISPPGETKSFKEVLESIVTIYSHKLHRDENRLDFQDESTRWAYVYLFIMRHSHLVHTALVEMSRYTQYFILWQQVPLLNVCAIGGGPGSDILGFALFMKTMGIKTLFHGTVIDKYNEWATNWASLHERAKDLNIERVDFISCDLSSNGISPNVRAAIQNAHIVTIVKFISSITAFVRNKAAYQKFPFLHAITPGTYVLYIDNEVGPHTDIFLVEAVKTGFRIIIGPYINDMSFPQVTGRNPNEPFLKLLSFSSAKSSKNMFILLQKM